MKPKVVDGFQVLHFMGSKFWEQNCSKSIYKIQIAEKPGGSTRRSIHISRKSIIGGTARHFEKAIVICRNKLYLHLCQNAREDTF